MRKTPHLRRLLTWAMKNGIAERERCSVPVEIQRPLGLNQDVPGRTISLHQTRKKDGKRVRYTLEVWYDLRFNIWMFAYYIYPAPEDLRRFVRMPKAFVRFLRKPDNYRIFLERILDDARDSKIGIEWRGWKIISAGEEFIVEAANRVERKAEENKQR